MEIYNYLYQIERSDNMKKQDLISIIVPCFNEEESIPVFYEEIKRISEQMNYVNFEYMFINDGSSDKTLEVLRKLSKKDKRVKYLSFSRNFGKEAGMFAGLNHVNGDYIAIMDVDLQDPPEKLIEMYKIITTEDYDCVGLYTKEHKDYNLVRNFLTKIWYKIIDKLSSTKQMPGARDFRLMTRKMVNAVISMREYNRYTKGLFSYVGFKTKWLEYEIPGRAVGTSKFPLKKLMAYSIEGITSFSSKPLIVSAYVGITFCIISVLAILIIILKTIIFGDPVSGWPSLACIMIFCAGVQLFFLGVIGIYLSKMYQEIKERPVYIINETEKDNK